jgi:hypothetical protein
MVDGSIVDSRRSLLLIAKVIAVSDFGFDGGPSRSTISRFVESILATGISM